MRIDDVLATRQRGLRTRPGTLLLGPTGARLWADYLEPRPGFVGAIDLIHKLNIPLLFTVAGLELDPPWDAEWRPSHLRVKASSGHVEHSEEKFITWDDCAVSRQVWMNRGPTDVSIRLDVDPSWMVKDRGDRFVEQHGFTVRALVRTPLAELWDGITIEPGDRLEFVIAAALGLAETETFDDLGARLDRIIGPGGPGEAVAGQVSEYQSWFADVPTFTSSDPVLDRTWAYRWFLLRHSLAVPGYGQLDGPLFYEGRAHKMAKTPWAPEGWEFSKLIPLSTPMHLLDARWYPDHTIGAGVWQTLRAAQGDDGLYYSRTVNSQFHAYANFLGWASYQYALVHPETPGAREMLASLSAQVQGERVKLVTGNDELPVETEHILTGKEYQPSYWYFHGYPDDPRDRTGFTPLKRVDRACYHYRNARGVAGLTRLLGQGDGAEFDTLASTVAADSLAKQWDEQTGFFYDLHHETDEKAMVRNVVGFYPYWAEITGPEHLPGLESALAAFDTGAPLPSVTADCPVYSPTGAWKGVYVKGRNGCSWNGPTWPYTNSVVIDGLAATSRRFNHRYDSAFGRLLRSYALLHFRQLDGRTPYLVEHYDSSTGEPISDEVDYNHSYFVDLVVRHVAGVCLDETGLVVDPLDIGLDHFALRGLHIAGRQVDVTYRRSDDVRCDAPVGLRVNVDGHEVAAMKKLGRVPIPLARGGPGTGDTGTAC